MQIFIAVSLLIIKAWKQPKCPLTNEWMNKHWCIHTIERYHAIKNTNYKTTWIYLKYMIQYVSEWSQISTYMTLCKRENYKDEELIVVTRVSGQVEYLNTKGQQLCVDGAVLYPECGDGYTTLGICQNSKKKKYTKKYTLGGFHVLAIVNSAAVNTGVHVSFLIMVFSGYMPRSGIAGSYSNLNVHQQMNG